MMVSELREREIASTETQFLESRMVDYPIDGNRRIPRRCASTASKSDAIMPTRPFWKQQDGASATSYARANSKAKGSCSQGNSRGLLELYGPSGLRGRSESVGHRLIPTFGPLGHEPLRWWRCAYHRLIASIPLGLMNANLYGSICQYCISSHMWPLQPSSLTRGRPPQPPRPLLPRPKPRWRRGARRLDGADVRCEV